MQKQTKDHFTGAASNTPEPGDKRTAKIALK